MKGEKIMFKIGQDKELAKAMAAAYKSGDEKQISQAWDDYTSKLQENIKKDYTDLLNNFDNKILANRGYHALTQKEQDWYQKWIDSAKTSNPKQAFADLIETESMPETIIEDVYENFVHNFRLLCFGRMQLCDHPGGESVAGAGTSDNFA